MALLVAAGRDAELAFEGVGERELGRVADAATRLTREPPRPGVLAAAEAFPPAETLAALGLTPVLTRA